MPIISVSLNDKNIQDLDSLQEVLGLSNRSEAIRLCLRSAEAEIKERMEITGEVEGVLVVVHDKHEDPWLNSIIHRHEGIIQTHVHSHLKDHKCLEVLIVRGEGDELKRMLFEILGRGMADYVKFVHG